MHYAIPGLTHARAIEPRGRFGGHGVGLLERWLGRRAERGGVVRHAPSGELALVSESFLGDAEFADTLTGGGLAPVWYFVERTFVI
jgi:hypothetical protein